MPNVFLPALLRHHAGGADWVKVEGATLRAALAHLTELHPALEGVLVRQGRPAPGFTLAIDGDIAAAGHNEPLRPETEIYFVPAIQGGGSPTA